jgi:hypothetical protein
MQKKGRDDAVKGDRSFVSKAACAGHFVTEDEAPSTE